MRYGKVNYQAATDGDRTVVEASLLFADELVINSVGSAGREPGDKSDPKIGEALAVARALRSIASRLERQAKGTMKHREDIQRHRAELVAKEKLKKLVRDYGWPGGPASWEEVISK
jgi:hypothetical protein